MPYLNLVSEFNIVHQETTYVYIISMFLVNFQLKKFRSLGCQNEALCTAACQVYIELCEGEIGVDQKSCNAPKYIELFNFYSQ